MSSGSWTRESVLRHAIKAQPIKGKLSKLNLFKIKNCSGKHEEDERSFRMIENICKPYYLMIDYCLNI